MSGIFGVVHLDGSPVQAGELDLMRSAMQEWGSDAGSSWFKGPAGVGSLIRFDTPESLHEHMPVESAGRFVLTAEARLDNRPELAGDLGLSTVEAASMPDGAMILRAYQKWGAEAPHHLLGDWSFAAWHPDERRLFLARDHLGNTALYYFQDEKRFAFASSRKALFALGLPRRLNEFHLACILVSWSAQYGQNTIELDLHRLPPAHTLALVDGRPRVSQYWWLEDTPELSLRNSGEYGEVLLALYGRAIQDRLRSTNGIGLFLSGGLDSGSTAVLASRALREHGGRLRAYTSTPMHDVTHVGAARSIGDEAPLAQAVAARAGNIDLVDVKARGRTPIQGMRRSLEIHGEPGHAANNSYWIHEVLACAQRDGVGTILTAQGGNGTISWTGHDRNRMLRHLLNTRSWQRTVGFLVYPHLPIAVIRGLRQILHARGLDWSHTAINPDFARRIGLSREHINHSGDATRAEDWYTPRQLRYAIIRPGASSVGAHWAEDSAAYGLDIRDATFDKRVMEFAISIPDHEYTGADGTNRYVLRAAMQGMLPDEVRLNQRHGFQAADLCQRLIDSAIEVEHALGDIESSELARRYLAPSRMREVWRSIQHDISLRTTLRAMNILARGLMAGMYLVDLQRASEAP